MNKQSIIKSKAPLRISLAGGGTDLNSYSTLYGGAVLNFTINKFVYTTIRKISHDIVLRSKDTKNSLKLRPSRFSENENKLILHLKTYKKMMDRYNNGKYIPLELETFSEAPIGSGLGSSSTLVVSMIKAYQKLLNITLSKHKIAELAFEIERFDCKFDGGKQDQYSASFGGLNFLKFNKNNSVEVEKIILNKEFKKKLEDSMIIFFVGKSRNSSKIINQQQKNISKNNSISLEAMHNIKKEAKKMKNFLNQQKLNLIINSLNRGWAYKKKLLKKYLILNMIKYLN